MKKTKDERLLDSLDYIDQKYIAGAEKYYKVTPANRISEKFARRNRMLKIAVAVAACLVLLAVAVPTATIVIERGEYTPPTVGAENSGVELELPPQYDGSRGLQYVINEDGKTASFVGFGSCTDEDIVIASYYEGLPVVEMRNQPYYDEDHHYNDFAYGSKYAKSITISDTVKRVLGAIIDECPDLERVYIGASVEAFQVPLPAFPSKVVSIKVSPENKNYSGEGNCLVDLRDKRLVWGCNTSIIPDNGSIESISVGAFYNAEHFSADYLPEGIKIIEPTAFAYCYGLVNLRLPSTLEKIWGSTFHNCINLESVDLNGYTEIPPTMFQACSSLKEIKGSEKITYIDTLAFQGCTSLTINLTPALEKIDEYAFAFLYRNGEAVINFAGTMAEWNAIEKAENWKSNSWLITVNCTDGVIKLTGK